MKKRLCEIATIQAGHQFRGKVQADATGNVPVIQMKDIDDDRRLRTGDFIKIKLDPVPETCLATRTDVLFLARGNRLTATPVPAAGEGALVSGSFFILRPKPRMVRPGFLAWFMNQPSFQAQVRSSVRGTDIPIIAKADLQDLWVCLPPLETQDRIVALDDLFAQEKKLFAALAQKRAQLLHALSLQAAGAGPSRKVGSQCP